MRPYKKLAVWKAGMKRASVAISCNITAGAARQIKKEFWQFLFIARGSLSELDTQLELSLNLKLIENEVYEGLANEVNKVNAMLNGLLKSITS